MLASMLLAAGSLSANLQDRVTIVATTDVHGRAMHWDYVNDREAPWGLTRTATVVDSIRRNTGDAVVLVDAGDLFQGNLFARYYATERRLALHPIVDAFNLMRYDVFVPGNHDFDFGAGFLDSALSYAQFNVISSNIEGANASIYRERVVVVRGGVRIGITGATTPGTTVWNRDRLGGRTVRPILPAVSRELERMQEVGVDLKVVVLHSGLGGTSSYETPGVGEENVAAQLAFLPIKPDVVVVGHTHGLIRDSIINGVHFLQPEPWAKSVAVAEVIFQRDERNRPVPRFIRGKNVSVSAATPDRDLAGRLDQAHRMARSWGELPIGHAEPGWDAQFARSEDTPLVDFINHVQLRETGAQLSATAAFATDVGFPPGVVKLRHVMALYPFENTLKVVSIDGATLKRYLERSAEYLPGYAPGIPATRSSIPGYNYDMVSGLEYVIDVSRPVGTRIRQMVFEGRIVQTSDRFTLAINDYRHVSGGFDMLAGLPIVQRGNRRVVDMLVDEVRRVGTLAPESYFVPSWSIVPSAAAQMIRIQAGALDPSVDERHAFRLIATSDLSGAVQPRVTPWSDGREVGGVVALKGWIDSLANACTCPTIVLDAGGALGGSLIADRSFGRLVVDAMNVMRFDAAAVGERELEWGVDTLRARMRQSHFPWLAANAKTTGRSARSEWPKDWVMLERAEVRVAVIGVSGSVPPISRGESGEFTIEDPVRTVQRAVPAIRSAGADFIVVLAHEEAYCEPSGCRGGLIDFMERLDSGVVDLVVGGHSASEAIATINGIPLLLPGARGLSVGVADIFMTGGTPRVVSDIHTVWADSVSSNVAVEAILRAAAFDGAAKLTTMKLPASSSDGESSLGRLVADAYRNVARADISLVHAAAVTGDLPVGDVTYEQAYAIQPVRYEIRRLLVRGSFIEELLEQIVRGARPTAYVGGLQFEYDPNGRPGERVRRIRLDGDRSLGRGDRYWLAVNDFMARGGAGFSLLQGVESESVGVSDYEAFTTYLLRLPRPVEAPAVARIRARR